MRGVGGLAEGAGDEGGGAAAEGAGGTEGGGGGATPGRLVEEADGWGELIRVRFREISEIYTKVIGARQDLLGFCNGLPQVRVYGYRGSGTPIPYPYPSYLSGTKFYHLHTRGYFFYHTHILNGYIPVGYVGIGYPWPSG